MSRLLALARDLRRRKARERHQLFVAEGVRAAEELLASPLQLRGALATGALVETPRGAAVRQALATRTTLEEVSDREFASAADTDSPQGVLAIGHIPVHALDTLELPPRVRLLVLDGIQDPGNAGTMLRTARALGAEATLALPGTVDLWNAKVVRSAMGAHFHHPVISATWDRLDSFRAERGLELWITEASGIPLDPSRAPDRLAIAFGNEGAGVSAEARARAARAIALPLAEAAESLNVAVAAGIFLYELRCR